MISLSFLGAAGTVTGSKYLVEYKGYKILVDCGLFQGLKNLRLLNWEHLSINASDIDAIVLTHAHIDHSGFIPRLVKDGFKGKVFCTQATLALCRILLPDTGYLLEEEAEYLNKRKLSKHDPALPLFSREDAERALKNFLPIGFHEEVNIVEEISATFYYAGHILGAASLSLKVGERVIAFSGDIGRPNDPVFRKPERLSNFDYLVVESTYGNKKHGVTNPKQDLLETINLAYKSKGVLLIPAFAVGRTQTLLHFLVDLKEENKLPDIPIYLNSPMAIEATSIFCQYQGLHKLSVSQCDDIRDIVHYVRSEEESRRLNMRKGPMVIISASGMATGGRILHHLKEYAPDPNNIIVLAGFQAAGTRGRSLQDGAREIKIHGQMVPVNAKVKTIENLSAHADRDEIIQWLRDSHAHPRKVFVTHGEVDAATKMAEELGRQLNWVAEVPSQNQKYELD